MPVLLLGCYRTASGMDEIHLSRDDLRFKITQKKIMKQNQTQNNKKNGTHQHRFLSRPHQSSINSLVTWKDVSKPRDTQLHYPEQRDRQNILGLTDGIQLISVTRDSLHVPEAREQPNADARECAVPKARKVPDPGSSSITLRMPSVRTVDDVAKVESLVNSYAPWSLDRLRQISPGELLVSSRDISPPRREEDLPRRLTIRIYDNVGMSTYTSKDVLNFSCCMNSAPSTTTAAASAAPLKTLTPLAAPRTLACSDAQMSSYAMNDQLTVDSFLQSLGLEKSAIYFNAEEVDMYALRQMGDSDLKELGIPLKVHKWQGPRKKVLLALLPRSKRPAA